MAPAFDDWVPPLPPGYNDIHRAFLQAFMSRGSITYREGRKLISAILEAQREIRGGADDDQDLSAITREQFDLFIAKARGAVSALDLDVRSTANQVTKERTWALVNTHSDPSTQAATAHTHEEVMFIKRMLDALFDTYNTRRMEVMAVTEAQAMKVARPSTAAGQRQSLDAASQPATQSADRGLKHSEVERLLPTLVAEGWLEKSLDGFFSLTPRTLMELSSWMRAEYNEPDDDPVNDWQRIKSCEACKDVLTIGQRCHNRDCNVRIHSICTEAFWRTRREKTCPRCATLWTGKNFVGEKAVTESESFQRGRRRSGAGRPADDGDEDVSEEEDDADDNEDDE